MSRLISLIGTGPSGFGYIQGLANLAKEGRLSPSQISQIHIFERSQLLGAGLPYDESMTDVEHLLNALTLSSSFPKHGRDFFEWIKNPKNQDDIRFHLKKLHQERLEEKLTRASSSSAKLALVENYEDIWQSIEKRYLNLEVGQTYHPRILYGLYASMTFEKNLATLREAGIDIVEHRTTDATSIERVADEKLQIGFSTISSRVAGAGMLVVDECILATGRWQELPHHISNRHCPDIWPSRNLSRQLDVAIADEMAKRAAESNDDKTFRIAIEGTSLSAIDALKTTYQYSKMTVDEDNKMVFEPGNHYGVILEVNMISRGGMMQKVKCERFWFDRFRDTEGKLHLPEGIDISDDELKKLSQPQEGEIRLWQLMAMTMRAVEIGYRMEGLEDKANIWNVALLALLFQVKRKEGAPEKSQEETSAFFASLKGSSAIQALAMMEFFGLELDGANYQTIIDSLHSVISAPGEDVMMRLRADMEMAATGDTEAGELIWQNIYYQNDRLTTQSFLTPEEEVLRFQIFERFHGVVHNAMPIQTAHEMLAMHKSGAFGVVALGFNSRKTFVEVGGKMTTESERETYALHSTEDRGICYGDKKYDFSIAARGISLNLDNAPELYQSMARSGLIMQRKVLFCSAEEFKERRELIQEKYGTKYALMIFNSLKQEADGNFYYYNRSIIPHNLQTRCLLDASSQALLCNNIKFLPSSGIATSISNGENLAATQYDFPATTVAARSALELSPTTTASQSVM